MQAVVFVWMALAACGKSNGSAAAQAVASITVDSTRRFQTITGWEATAQAGQENTQAYLRYRDSLLSLAVNDLGITRLRLEFRSGLENPIDLWAERRAGRRAQSRCARYSTVNDNDDPFVINPAGFHFAQVDHTMEQVVLPLKKRVEQRGEKFYLNANYVSFMVQCGTGARYDHTSVDEYAEFVLASFLHLRDKYGLVPDAWEVILEPENTYFWRGRQIGEAIVATARRLEKHGFKPRFIAPSTTKAGNAPKFFDDMIAVPGVQPYLAEFSYHRYRGYNDGDFVAIADRAARYHVRTAMLEHIGAGYKELHKDLVVAGVSAWQQFALAYPAKEDNGAQYFLIDNADSATPAPRMAQRTRYLRQYFRYVRPGFVRVAAGSNHASVEPVAFVGPGNRQVVVLKSEGPARITVTGVRPGVYTARYTTDKATDVAANDVRVKGSAIEFSIPAKGVITLIRL